MSVAVDGRVHGEVCNEFLQHDVNGCSFHDVHLARCMMRYGQRKQDHFLYVSFTVLTLFLAF